MDSRTRLLVSLATLAAFCLVIGIYVLWPSAPPPAEIALPAPVAPPPAAAEALPPLPEVQLSEVPIHTVPEDGGPGDSHPLDLRHPEQSAGEPERHVSDEVANGARQPLPAVPKQFSGAATPTGATSLQVGTVAVQLFGVKPPPGQDHCSTDAASSCTSAAKQALVTRLGSDGHVSCRVPNPKPGVLVAFAICLDNNGIDLGGYLIGEGLAVADTGQSYDYVGAEGIARDLKRGLWKFR